MATFSAILATSIIRDEYDEVISSNIRVADDYVTFDGWLPTFAGVDQVITNNTPISAIPQTFGSSVRGLSLGGNDEFYNRIIINPTAINAGNIITAQTTAVSVWNGYFVNRTLSSIGESGTDGITITPTDSPPATILPLEEQTWEVEVTINGPPIVDAVYTLHFDTGDEIIEVYGQRIFAWAFAPDWSRPLLERLQWSTNVIESYDGTEQRIALRSEPKRYLEYQFGITGGQERRKFENIVFGWGARTFLVPIWWEGQRLPSNLSAGASGVTLARVSSDWFVGGNAIIRSGNYTFEIVEIQGISGTTITFTRPTEQSWDQNTARIFPAIAGYIEGDLSIDRFTGDQIISICRFLLDTDGNTPSYTPTNYRSQPVITEISDWSRDISAEYQRRLQVLDYGTGKFARDDHAAMPFIVTQHHFTKDGLPQIDALRGLFYALKGRQKMAWWPTWLEDVVPVAQISSGSTYIDVEHNYIEQHLAGKPGRRDIQIQLLNGTIWYRRVTGVSELSSTVERLSIDSSVPQTVQPSDVRRISWMVPARLETDAVEFAWRWYDWAESSVNIRAVRDDV
jgi:hypothetical protein